MGALRLSLSLSPVSTDLYSNCCIQGSFHRAQEDPKSCLIVQQVPLSSAGSRMSSFGILACNKNWLNNFNQTSLVAQLWAHQRRCWQSQIWGSSISKTSTIEPSFRMWSNGWVFTKPSIFFVISWIIYFATFNGSCKLYVSISTSTYEGKTINSWGNVFRKGFHGIHEGWLKKKPKYLALLMGKESQSRGHSLWEHPVWKRLGKSLPEQHGKGREYGTPRTILHYR